MNLACAIGIDTASTDNANTICIPKANCGVDGTYTATISAAEVEFVTTVGMTCVPSRGNAAFDFVYG